MIMIDAAHTAQSVAEYIRDIGAWRRRRVLDGGNDATIDPSVNHDAFADFLEQLPPHDVRLLALARLTHLTEDGVPAPGPRLSSALTQLEDYAPATFDAFLEYLVHVAIDDALDANAPTVPLLVDISQPQSVVGEV